MEKDKLLSVILPIYKVENYIEQCVKSIVQQTYENLEIILVDDGSPDKCPEICDTWAQKDDRIKVIHKENGGLSDARNAGLKMAVGQYIAFIDSDDWVDVNMFEKAMQALEEHHADIAAVNVYYAYEDGRKEVRNPEVQKLVYSNPEAMQKLLEESVFQQTVWNKVYRRSVIQDIEFPKGKLNEDEYWSYRAFANAGKVVYLNEALYYYRQREGSIMSAFNLRRLDGLEARMQRLAYLKEHYPTLITGEKLRLCKVCIYFYQCVLKMENVSEIEKGKQLVRQYMDELSFSKEELKQYSLKDRMAITASKKNLDLYCKVHKVV